MKVVIDISKELYKALCSRDYFVTGMRSNKTVLLKLIGAIRRGTVLPKGHGRLIDADELTESILCKTFGLRSVDIENVPTIIEADRGEE